MTWRRAELAALVVIAVALPLFEAPKNIFWFLYLFAWIGNRAQAGSHGGPWRAWDTLIAGLLASAGLGAALAGLHGGEWVGARDVMRYGLILWAVSRTDYDAREWRWIFIALLAGTLAASLDGALLLNNRKDPELGLRSVGHPNHSAIYLAIMFGGAMAWLLSYWKAMTVRERAAWGTGAALVAVAVVATGSRVAVVVTAVYGLILGWWFVRRSWKPLFAITAALGVAVGLIVLAQPWVLQKQLRNMGEDNVTPRPTRTACTSMRSPNAGRSASRSCSHSCRAGSTPRCARIRRRATTSPGRCGDRASERGSRSSPSGSSTPRCTPSPP